MPSVNREMWREPVLRKAVGLGRSTAWAQVSDGLLTPPVKISTRAVAWPSDEIQAIMAARIAGKSDEEIKKLVVRLVQAREQLDRVAA